MQTYSMIHILVDLLTQYFLNILGKYNPQITALPITIHFYDKSQDQ